LKDSPSFPLAVAKSWADVVKLGVKQTQTKVVKQGPQRQVNKRQRRPNTPKVHCFIYTPLLLFGTALSMYLLCFDILSIAFFSIEACSQQS
jgi:hypothetical protein